MTLYWALASPRGEPDRKVLFRAAGARYARVARNEEKLLLLPDGPWRSLRFGPSTKPAPSHGVLPGAAGTYGMPWEIVEVNGLLRVIMTGNGIPHNSFRERSRACGAAQRAARARLSSMFFDELAAIVRRSRGTDLTAASVGASSRGRSAGCTAECRQPSAAGGTPDSNYEVPSWQIP